MQRGRLIRSAENPCVGNHSARASVLVGEMSENLELVHAILADWERGNFRSVDWADAHIEYAIADDPGAKIGRGIPAMTRTWREFLSAWED
jgi:hypothetical protein